MDTVALLIKKFGLEEVSVENIVHINNVTNYFKKQEKQLYEYCWLHMVLYNSFDKKILYTNNDNFRSYIFFEEETKKLIFFAPIIKNSQKFFLEILHLKDSIDIEITLQSITNDYIQLIESNSQNIPFFVIPRSLNEVIYSTEILTKLEGKDFSKFRNIKNKFIKSKSLEVRELNNLTINDCITILDSWQMYQGIRYEKNKYEKENFLLSNIAKLNINNIYGKIFYFNKIPLSYAVYTKSTFHRDTAIMYLLKGINRPSDGGVHGITDMTYLYMMEELYKQKILYVNDGDLGQEEGTILHKLRFKPIKRYNYYDLIIK